MPTIEQTAFVSTAELPEIRRIGASDLEWALREGWKDFRDKRGDLLFIGIL